MQNGIIHSLSRGVVVGAFIAFCAGDVLAQNNNIEHCDEYCDTSCPNPPGLCKLANSSKECQIGLPVVTCGDGEGPVVLKSGTHLNLNGRILECETDVDCDDAVVMEAQNSSVFNSASAAEGVITGGFWNGVDCGGFDGTKVEGVRIHDTYTGTRDCKMTLNSVISGTGRVSSVLGNFGIVLNKVTNLGDRIQENYITGKLHAIHHTGDNTPQITDNVIHTGYYNVCGVWLLADSKAKVQRNVFFGKGNSIFPGTYRIICPATAPSGATIEFNLCDALIHPDCQKCQDDEHCVKYVAPFFP